MLVITRPSGRLRIQVMNKSWNFQDSFYFVNSSIVQNHIIQDLKIRMMPKRPNMGEILSLHNLDYTEAKCKSQRV